MKELRKIIEMVQNNKNHKQSHEHNAYSMEAS